MLPVGLVQRGAAVGERLCQIGGAGFTELPNGDAQLLLALADRFVGTTQFLLRQRAQHGGGLLGEIGCGIRLNRPGRLELLLVLLAASFLRPHHGTGTTSEEHHRSGTHPHLRGCGGFLRHLVGGVLGSLGEVSVGEGFLGGGENVLCFGVAYVRTDCPTGPGILGVYHHDHHVGCVVLLSELLSVGLHATGGIGDEHFIQLDVRLADAFFQRRFDLPLLRVLDHASVVNEL